MRNTHFTDIYEKYPRILGEGAVIERLRRNEDITLDPYVVNSAFIYHEKERKALEAIYREYLDVGLKYDLPIVLSTPTWRASQEYIQKAGYSDRDMNGDNYRFLDELRKDYGEYGKKVIICGLMSCKWDAYNPKEALPVDEALDFHSWQAETLAQSGVDFILAATLPALSEARGLAVALSRSGVPYVISFVGRPEGTLLDGAPLKDAIDLIDSTIDPRPFAFMLNCTHASFFRSALLHDQNSSAIVRKRVIGLFANTAALNPEELNNCEALVEEDPDVFGKDVAGLYRDLGMKILGGCCGTDGRHIERLAIHLTKNIDSPY